MVLVAEWQAMEALESSRPYNAPYMLLGIAS
jgi:hypothetical protein